MPGARLFREVMLVVAVTASALAGPGCRYELPALTDAAGPDAAPSCGDGVVNQASEQCDDGNQASDDSCDACRLARCGDGIVRVGVEECDEGDDLSQDGCTAPGCLRCQDPAAPYPGAAIDLESNGGHCYVRFDDLRDWASSQAACATLGGHLVTVEDMSAQATFNGLVMAPPAAGPWFIGMRLDPTASWVTGEQVVWTRWATGQPAPTMGCVSATDSGGGGVWSVENCAAQRGRLCEIDAWVRRPEDGHAYKLFHEEVTWDEARERCASLGPAIHLATITSAAEQDFLEKAFARGGWLGAAGTAESGFAWLDGEPVTVSGWAAGEPADADAGGCVHTDDEDAWADAPCFQPHRYLCEAD